MTTWFSSAIRVQLALLLFSIFLAGCATLPEKLPKGPEGHAALPAETGNLAELENNFHSRLGIEASAWQVLDSNEDAFRWRLALVDSAKTSLDIQYYFWWKSARARKSAGFLREI